MISIIKRTVLIYFLIISSFFAYSQSPSVLSSGIWYKIAVSESGIHKIDYSFLSQIGINPDSIDPRKIKIYGNGGGMLPQANSAFRHKDLIENPIYIEGEGDNIFNETDYILFYAKGPDTWMYDSNLNTYKHSKNIYSDYAYYFITIGNDNGKRISDKPNLSTTGTLINTFDEHLFHEKDLVNILKSGREWYGESFSLTTEQTYSYFTPGIVSNTLLKVYSHVMANSLSSTSFNLSLNNQNLGTQNIGAKSTYQYAPQGEDDIATFSINTNLIAGNTLYLKYNFNKGSSSASVGYLNKFTVNFQREIRLYDNQTSFRSSASTSSSTSTFVVSQITSDAKIWDVTDIDSVMNQIYTLTGNQGSFTTNTNKLREFVVFQGSSFPKPIFIGSVPNQNLHSIAAPNLPDLVIVVPEQFLSSVERLAQFRRTNDNMNVLVVTPTQIYNEFSSGAQDITAIRDFMRMLYERKTASDSLRYLLLFGDASYDYKNRIGGNTNFVPIYESRESLHPINSHSSDDYFGFLDDNEGEWIENYSGDHVLDIGIGRLVVKNIQEADGVVSKIINYSSNPECLGKWRNKITFVADDGNANLHLQSSETLSAYIESNYKEYIINKLYIDAFPQVPAPGGESSEVKQKINEAVDQGTFIMNYTGHGGEIGLAQEGIVDVSQIQNWNNLNKLFFFVTATCEFGRYEDPGIVSGGESSLLNPNGGAIGLLASTRPVYSNTNLELNQAFYNCLFKEISGEMPRLGDIIRITKNKSLSGINNRNYALLGDPSLKLAYPQKEVVITSINDSLVAPHTDTLKALGLVNIKGAIQDNGALINDFDGTVNITVYDRESTISTMGSHGDTKTSFSFRNNFIFEGTASVKDGEFELSFIAPKDISYSFSSGKISLYAKKNKSSIDANGEYSDFIIGGTADNVQPDNSPPIIQLFMNDETFRSGGLTGPNSNLYAILSDDNGINISSSGIGHEITARLDNSSEVIALNEYYSAEQDNYKRGIVLYPFYNLSPGRHSLTLKVWDTHNNSSEAYIEFIVAEKEGLTLQNVYNYPNPFSENTTFQFEHNRAGDDLQVEIQIFSTTGQLVRVIERSYYDSPGRIADLEWGISHESSDPSSGIYMYVLKVKSLTDGTEDIKYQKLIVY